VSFGAPFPPGGPVTGGFVSSGQVIGSGTVAGLSFGAISADRYLVAVVGGIYGGGGSITGVTIGGVAATIVATQINATVDAVIAIAAVPAGASGSVVVTGPTFAGGGTQVFLYALYGVGSATPVATANSAANPSSLPLNGLPGGSFAIAGSEVFGTINSWTNATQDSLLTQSGSERGASASASNQSGNIAIASSMTPSAGGPASVAAAWR
jgi:hypothetical protein